MTIKIDSIHELMLLHKAIMVAKFPEFPTETAFYGSPYLSSVANKVLDELISLAESNQTYGSKGDWNHWRKLTQDRSEWKSIIKILENGNLRSISESNKKEHIENLVSPFLLNEEDLNTLLNYKRA